MIAKGVMYYLNRTNQFGCINEIAMIKNQKLCFKKLAQINDNLLYEPTMHYIPSKGMILVLYRRINIGPILSKTFMRIVWYNISKNIWTHTPHLQIEEHTGNAITSTPEGNYVILGLQSSTRQHPGYLQVLDITDPNPQKFRCLKRTLNLPFYIMQN